MIDGVRISISSSRSSSQSKSIQKEEIQHPKSGEKKDDVKVLVSEEECEIVNVRSAKQTLSFFMSRIRVPLVLYRRFMTSSSALLVKRFKIHICEYMFTYSLTLSLSLTLSIKMGGYRPELDMNAADDNEPYTSRKAS